jgi:hypothetical protein
MKTEFVTSEGEHWYPSPTIKDKWYVSVSTICGIFPKGKGFEMYLAKQNSWEEAQDILAEAGQRGTIVHEATEALERGETLYRDMYNLEQWQMITSFVKWYEEYKPKVVAIEKQVVSDRQETGGKIDRVYLIDGKVTLVDIKTSKKIYDSQWAQTAKYAKLWDETFPKKMIEQTAILRLGASTKLTYEFKTHDFGEMVEDHAIFMSLKYIWHYVNRNKTGPKILEVPTELKLKIKKKGTSSKRVNNK